MTLILAYIDDNVTVHVADRRLTVKTGTTYSPVTEDAVKVDLIRGSLLVSYAGRSKVATVDTPTWLEQQLSPAASADELGETLNAIADKLTGIFTRPGYVDQLLIVTITGWALNAENKLTPVIGTVTNQHPTTLSRLPKFKAVAADLYTATGSANRGGWTHAGRLNKAGHASVDRWVKKSLTRGVSPLSITNVFAYQIRSAARADLDQTIGRTLRAAILPRAVLEHVLANQLSDYTMAYNDAGHWVRGWPMVVDIPENVTRMGSVEPRDLRPGDGPTD